MKMLLPIRQLLKVIFLFFLFGMNCVLLNAQKQGNIWYFGDHAGIDFNSGIPIAITNGATYNNSNLHSEGTSVICDSSNTIIITGVNQISNFDYSQS